MVPSIGAIRFLGADETSAFANAYQDPVPLLFYFYGSTAPAALEAAEAGGPIVPSLHTPGFAPDLRPTVEAGTKSLIGVARRFGAPGSLTSLRSGNDRHAP